MNLLAWTLSLSILIYLMVQAVTFHKATVCRQKAWLKGTELITRSALSESREKERDYDLYCKTYFFRTHHKVTWQQSPSVKENHFVLPLEGKL